jgi:hypothetical protein
MKKAIVIFMVIAAFLVFHQGKAQAVIGAVDDVPAQDIIFPFICEHDPATGVAVNPLDVLMVVAEVQGLEGVPSAASAQLEVFDWDESNLRYDDSLNWTGRDVWTDTACSIVIASGVNSNDTKSLLKDLDGDKVNDYYMGYLTLTNDRARNQFIGWWYLADLANGFVAGANAIQSENGHHPETLGENYLNRTETIFDPGDNDGNATSPVDPFNVGDDLPTDYADYFNFGPIALFADAMFPRYFLLNDNANTWTWWIMLSGANSNDYACDVCDEEEECVSKNAHTEEFNVIDVWDILPDIHDGFPKGGFAICGISGLVDFGGRTITSDYDSGGFSTDVAVIDVYYSIFGWDYERADVQNLAGNWSIVRPIHMDRRFIGAGLPYPVFQLDEIQLNFP